MKKSRADLLDTFLLIKVGLDGSIFSVFRSRYFNINETETTIVCVFLPLFPLFRFLCWSHQTMPYTYCRFLVSPLEVNADLAGQLARVLRLSCN